MLTWLEILSCKLILAKPNRFSLLEDHLHIFSTSYPQNLSHALLLLPLLCLMNVLLIYFRSFMSKLWPAAGAVWECVCVCVRVAWVGMFLGNTTHPQLHTPSGWCDSSKHMTLHHVVPVWTRSCCHRVLFCWVKRGALNIKVRNQWMEGGGINESRHFPQIKLFTLWQSYWAKRWCVFVGVSLFFNAPAAGGGLRPVWCLPFGFFQQQVRMAQNTWSKLVC